MKKKHTQKLQKTTIINKQTNTKTQIPTTYLKNK